MKELTMIKILLVLFVMSITVGIITFFVLDPTYTTPHNIPEIDNRQYILFPVLDNGQCSSTTTRLNSTHCIRFTSE